MDIPKIVTISEARANLSRILSDLSHAGPDARPVLIGSHSKPQAVLLSIEAFEALSERTARRTAAVSATGFVEATGGGAAHR